MPGEITIEWLAKKWSGVVEEVSRSTVKQCGVLEVGMVVKVSYKSMQYKARIVALRKRQPERRRTPGQALAC